MSEVVVQFYGICTHVKIPGTEPEGNTHRVILPKATQERIDDTDVLWRQRIKAHVARLQIRNEDFREAPSDFDGFRCVRTITSHHVWDLDGVTLSVKNAGAPERPAVPDDADPIPHLSAFCCDSMSLLPGYDKRNGVLVREHTACFFNFTNVTALGRKVPDGEAGLRATAAVVTVATKEDPIIIAVNEFEIKVAPGATITISSYPLTPSQSTDKDADFLLHFLSATNVPPKSWFPPAPPWVECSTEIGKINPPVIPNEEVAGVFTGPGCSNSIYP
jgi:hypothetical protein